MNAAQKKELAKWKASARRARARIRKVAAGEDQWTRVVTAIDRVETRAWDHGLTGEQGCATAECERIVAELRDELEAARDAAADERAWRREVERVRLDNERARAGECHMDAVTRAYHRELRSRWR